MCQPMPIVLSTHWDLDSETNRFTPRQNQTRGFENSFTSCFQRTRPDYKNASFYTTSRQKKMDYFSVDCFCSHCNTVFEAMVCFYDFCPCQEIRTPLTEKDNQRGRKRGELNELRQIHIQEKRFAHLEMLKCRRVSGGDCTNKQYC